MKKIIFIICVVILGYSANSYSTMLLDKVVAVVNREVITWSNLYKAMEFEAADEIRAMKDEDKRRFFKYNEMVFLENLIDIRLKLQEAARYGIMASDNDVNMAIKEIKGKHFMTDEMFKEAISNEGFTLSEYRRHLSEQITISRIVDGEVRRNILITEKEIDEYLSKNKELIKKNEGFYMSHIFLRKTDNKRQIEERAQDLYERIKAGEDFSDIARQYSDGISAKVGGDLGFMRISDISSDFLNVLSKMKEGDISEPFQSGDGIHIIRLNGKKELKGVQELKEEVRQRLLEEKFSREYKSWIKGLKARAHIKIKLN